LNAHAPALATPDLRIVATASTPPCLIVNPRSFSASRGLATQATALARSHGAEVVSVDGPDATRAAITKILARRQRQVMLLAGDGTVCAVVDQLSNLPAGAWTPDLLVLPGGRTNLTAADLVPGGRALPTLKRALLRADEQRWDAAVEERCALRIEQSPAPPRHGFFFSAALIDSVIRQCHQHRADLKRHGDLSTFGYLLRLGARSLIGRSGMSCPRLDVDAGALRTQSGPIRLLLATTLLHRTGLFDPYAARGQGDVRLTSVSGHAPRFWRSLPRLLTGRYTPDMNTDNGYLSGRCERVQIGGLVSYMLDGEAFDADPTRPVTISAGPRLRFIRP
jgi:diacylglycerol kinase family enzyme